MLLYRYIYLSTLFNNVVSLVELGVHNFLDFKSQEGKKPGYLFRVELVEESSSSKKPSCSLNFLILSRFNNAGCFFSNSF